MLLWRCAAPHRCGSLPLEGANNSRRYRQNHVKTVLRWCDLRKPADGLAPHPGRQLSLDNASSYNTLIINANGERGGTRTLGLALAQQIVQSARQLHFRGVEPLEGDSSASPTLCGGGLGGLQGETREINEIPADYLSKSRVLKHLAKEMKQDAKGGGCRCSTCRPRDTRASWRTGTRRRRRCRVGWRSAGRSPT
ncbi:uncharacterized protein LOC135943856 [Cloeon dipterum]|uniref:uncharacterized protein LOC135943856 n=1 Tax=Cloeon dipterum TaxID=197152 RepID=UPI00322046CE